MQDGSAGGALLQPFFAVEMEWLAPARKMFLRHFRVGKLQFHLCFVDGAGGFGVDFSLATDDFKSGIDLVSQKILSHGVTSFCPTLVTSPPSVYHQVSDFLPSHPQGDKGLRLVPRGESAKAGPAETGVAALVEKPWV